MKDASDIIGIAEKYYKLKEIDAENELVRIIIFRDGGARLSSNFLKRFDKDFAIPVGIKAGMSLEESPYLQRHIFIALCNYEEALEKELIRLEWGVR